MKLRPAEPDELIWIKDAWLKSFADSDQALLCTPRGDERTSKCMTCERHHFSRDYHAKDAAGEYKTGQARLIDVLLSMYGATVAEADNGLLDGFMCATPPRTVHYVYVRLSARGHGIARKLVDTLGVKLITYTHRSRGLIGARLPDFLRYDPYGVYWSLLP